MADPVKIAGVIVVVTDHEGDVVAEVSDFHRSGIGGCTLEEAQSMRAREQIKVEFFRAMTSPRFQKGVTGYLADQFWRMAQENGFKMTVLPVKFTMPEKKPNG